MELVLWRVLRIAAPWGFAPNGPSRDFITMEKSKSAAISGPFGSIALHIYSGGRARGLTPPARGDAKGDANAGVRFDQLFGSKPLVIRRPTDGRR